MVVVRCTRKLLDRLGQRPRSDATSTTILGDWYATILFTKPQQVILLVNAATRLPVVIPTRDGSTIPARFAGGLTDVLTTLEVPVDVIGAEVREMAEVVFTTTASRSVVGTMNDFANHVEWALEDGAGGTLHALSLELANTPVGPLRYGRPRDLACRLLIAPGGA